MTFQVYKYNSSNVFTQFMKKESTMLENLIASGQWISLIKDR